LKIFEFQNSSSEQTGDFLAQIGDGKADPFSAMVVIPFSGGFITGGNNGTVSVRGEVMNDEIRLSSRLRVSCMYIGNGVS
jgi:hypothetical protein